MKILYESILDDEDVLIDRVKQYSDNPLITLYSIYKETSDLKKDMKRSFSIASDIIDALKLSKCIINIFDNRINVYHPKSLRANDSIITGITRAEIINPKYIMLQIRFAGDDYIEKRGAKCIIIEAGASKLKTHIKAIDKFAEKYILEKSPSGNRYILW